MTPLIASLAYSCGIAGLFYLDRDKSVRTSKALWLAVAYLWILGSRPLSAWLGVAPAAGTNVQLEGSPIDAAFFTFLFIAAISVLAFRGPRIIALVNANLPILIYFAFCLFSVIWSAYTGVAFKRWFKSIGDVVMVLIVVTDDQPVAALRRLFSRLGFILMPLSLLFIKYYPYLGRQYGAWNGEQVNIGVTEDKNLLGVITFVLLLGAVWRVLELLWGAEATQDRRRHLWAQATLLALGIWLLILANSATSLSCSILGAGFMVATRRRFIRSNPGAVHALMVLLILIAGLVLVLGGGATAAEALGRTSTLSGRTDIWAAVIPMATNPLVGAGFESFWLNPRVHARLWDLFPNLPLNEAHDGYLEVYLNLGWVGVALIVLILADAYRRAMKAFRREPALGGLLLAYVLTAITYNITEAGFRMMGITWIFLLLSVLQANVIASVSVPTSQPLDAPSDRSRELPARNAQTKEPRRTTYVLRGLR
jgi:exopolysaccharide production protein ExoQ